VGDFVAPNGITASSSREYSYPINQSVYVAISATLGLRSDGTVWDGSVSSTVGDPVQQRFAHQLGTPPHAVAVATFGFVDAALLADGTVFQSRARDSLQGVSGFAKVPGLDSVLLPPGDVAAPDFDVLGPPVTDISPGSSADVPVTVVRLGGFTGDIAVSGAGLPAGLSLTPQTIPGAATTATLRFTAASSLVRFDGYLAVQLTSGALSHVTQFGFRTPRSRSAAATASPCAPTARSSPGAATRRASLARAPPTPAPTAPPRRSRGSRQLSWWPPEPITLSHSTAAERSMLGATTRSASAA
jgi:hypothetical protein